MLDNQTKQQLQQYLELLENPIILSASLSEDESSQKMRNFLEEVTSLSSKITLEEQALPYTPSFEIKQTSISSGLIFAGIPLGHEFSSFVLALLQISGRAPKIDESLIKQIKAIDKAYHFESVVSLTCHICPEVVQTLNIFTVLNPLITHTMIEGGIHQEIVNERDIMAVPTVFLDGEEFSSGKLTVEQLLEKLAGSIELDEEITNQVYDSLIIGGGPAGASAAIYSARKGIKTALVCEEFGGQVMETLGIENMIGTPYTEGPKLMAQVNQHVKEYNVQEITGQRVTQIKKTDLIEVELTNGSILKTKSAIISTGARWRHINVPGEKEFKNKGVAYCPHCDGPIFAGKPVAVIGGGNSGIEAAIDLAGIVKHVYVLEFLPELKADKVLQDKLYSLKNVTVITNAQTTAITGTNSVEGLTYIDRQTQETQHLAIEGVFVLIGLMPNTEWLKDTLELNERGEINIAANGETSLPGVFAAGDCTNQMYKQIIISMGSGATAALGAFDYLMRNY